jgi:hypothetical protein
MTLMLALTCSSRPCPKRKSQRKTAVAAFTQYMAVTAEEVTEVDLAAVTEVEDVVVVGLVAGAAAVVEDAPTGEILVSGSTMKMNGMECPMQKDSVSLLYGPIEQVLYQPHQRLQNLAMLVPSIPPLLLPLPALLLLQRETGPTPRWTEGASVAEMRSRSNFRCNGFPSRHYIVACHRCYHPQMSSQEPISILMPTPAVLVLTPASLPNPQARLSDLVALEKKKRSSKYDSTHGSPTVARQGSKPW